MRYRHDHNFDDDDVEAFLFSFPSRSISSFYQCERCETRSDVIGLMDSREKEKRFVLAAAWANERRSREDALEKQN